MPRHSQDLNNLATDTTIRKGSQKNDTKETSRDAYEMFIFKLATLFG